MTRSLLKANAPLLASLMRLLDPLLLISAGFVAYRAYLGSWEPPDHYVVAMLGLAAACALLFPMLGLYAPQRGVSVFEEIRGLVNSALLLAALWFTFLFLSKSGANYSRIWSAYWIVLMLISHLAFRGAIRLTLRRLRRQGYNLRHAVIVGAGTHGREVAARLKAASWSGISVHGFYDDDAAAPAGMVDGIRVLGGLDRIADDLAGDSIDEVWIALPLRAEDRIREMLDALRQTSAVVRYVPDIYSFHLLHHTVSEVAGMPVLNLTDSPHTGVDSTLKALEDLVLASFLLVTTLPLWLAIAIGVKLSSPGPTFYRQERVTWNGQRFTMLKFRSMPQDAESTSGPVWSRQGEPRATAFGAFLRRYSLDELPQIVNVIKGEMSFVGPRPERPEFVRRFRQQIPGYMQKHLVKAGITGWAQVNDLRGDTDLSKRIEYDLYYIENWSVWFDLRIIALTIVHIVRTRHSH